MITKDKTGIFNANGKYGDTTMNSFIHECHQICNSNTEFIWINDEKFLEKHDLKPWTVLPMYLPMKWNHFFNLDIQKAISNGLKFHPLHKTISDTLDWSIKFEKDNDQKDSITREKEQQVIKEYLVIHERDQFQES